jgi:hypothetical protein
MPTDCSFQLTFWDLGRQEVTVDFDGGQIVTDAGLLPIRLLDQQLGVLSQIADRLADPRALKLVTHTREAILTQEVYQILAGYPDGNDAQELRHNPLFQTIVGVTPDGDHDLASGSTLNRFHQAYTRRQAELPLEERSAQREVNAAMTQRLRVLNDYLPELFIRTRRTVPTTIILDIDPTDDPTHGQQVLSFFHGYFDQHQYFPLMVFEGQTGFPLAAWLRPGTVHASCGAVETLGSIVRALKAAWPEVVIQVRGDTGLAIPGLYEFCEKEGLQYAIGFASNEVLKQRVAQASIDVETYYRYYQQREPEVQRFEVIEDYQAEGWSQPRRIVAKIEINRHGLNRRFVVTNLPGQPEEIYKAALST